MHTEGPYGASIVFGEGYLSEKLIVTPPNAPEALKYWTVVQPDIRERPVSIERVHRDSALGWPHAVQSIERALHRTVRIRVRGERATRVPPPRLSVSFALETLSLLWMGENAYRALPIPFWLADHDL